MSRVELHNADCLEVMRSLPDKSIDVLITDPPYGLGEWVGKNKSRGGGVIQSNGKSIHVPAKEWGVQAWDNQAPDPEYFIEMLRVSKNQIIFGGNYFTDRLPPSPCWLYWDKENTGNFADFEAAWTSYKANFDCIIDAIAALENDLEPAAVAWASFKTAARIFKYRWNGMLQGTIGNKKLNEKRVHPTQKPTPLMEWVVQNYSKPGDSIADFFMGSGTTGVACMNLGRDFIGCEKEKGFYAIAKDRIEAAKSQLSF